MLIQQKTLIIALVLSLISSLLVLDQLVSPGEAATYDSRIHITNIAMFHRALSDGDFPVAWADSFSNYGSPIPIVSQQLTPYLGSILMTITQDPLISYKLLLLFGTILSTLSMYGFLRIHTSVLSSVIGVIVYNFSAYRIFNIYVRGALPEFFALIFIPLVLIAIHRWSQYRHYKYIVLSTIWSTLLFLTHPFVFLISQILFLPYLIYLHKEYQNHYIFPVFLMILAFSLGISAYYLLPLVVEMKYFVISTNPSQLVPNQHLSLEQFFIEKWPVFTNTEVFIRGNRIQTGVIDSVILILGLGYLAKAKKAITLRRYFILPSLLLIIFFMTQYSEIVYEKTPFLHSIQFPWRMLSAFILLPSIVLSLTLDQVKKPLLPITLIILSIIILRLPQTYGKNYSYYPTAHYQRTIKNLHFDSMNTIWTASTDSYPIKKIKPEIIDGIGKITSQKVTNSTREYQINAQSPVRLRDNTFYFPEWKVWVDGVETNIEFQDINHRGVITYQVPRGDHKVTLTFTPTRLRLFGNIISLLSITSLVIFSLASYFIHANLFKKS